ncbi:MAG: hypothetical protein M3434_03555, partial [Gemmatimonadota bacterium]|nr:hypothetical protein [Gemmatimonadota bacterium]
MPPREVGIRTADQDRFRLTDTAADRAALRETVPIFAELFTARVLAGAFCDSALPAADLDVLLVRPSRSVFDAAFAALV